MPIQKHPLTLVLVALVGLSGTSATIACSVAPGWEPITPLNPAKAAVQLLRSKEQEHRVIFYGKIISKESSDAYRVQVLRWFKGEPYKMPWASQRPIITADIYTTSCHSVDLRMGSTHVLMGGRANRVEAIGSRMDSEYPRSDVMYPALLQATKSRKP